MVGTPSRRRCRARSPSTTSARAAVIGNGGIIVKMVGDSVHAAFSDPLSALLAAVALQRRARDPMTTGGLALRVRSGFMRARCSGATATSSARRSIAPSEIMSAGNKGQDQLLSAPATAAALVEDRLPGCGMTLRDLGRGAPARHRSRRANFQLVLHPELQEQFPALRGLEPTPSDIPNR